MNIIELSNPEISAISGADGSSSFYTFALANLFGAGGAIGGHFYLYAQKLHTRNPQAPKMAIITQTFTALFLENSIKNMLSLAYHTARGCVFGTIVGCCIAYPLSLIGLTHIS